MQCIAQRLREMVASKNKDPGWSQLNFTVEPTQSHVNDVYSIKKPCGWPSCVLATVLFASKEDLKSFQKLKSEEVCDALGCMGVHTSINDRNSNFDFRLLPITPLSFQSPSVSVLLRHSPSATSSDGQSVSPLPILSDTMSPLIVPTLPFAASPSPSPSFSVSKSVVASLRSPLW